MTEQQVIEQLSQYRKMQARLQVLSTYSVGGGITVSRLNEDDQLQELHRRLRSMPSYMYLTEREQKLEMTAHAYLTRYPAGTRAQLEAVPRRGVDDEDDELLYEIRNKINKVIEARGGTRNDIDAVIDRLAEYQDLREEIKRIDTALEALEAYRPEWARLLRLRYVDNMKVGDVTMELHIARKTFDRWRRKAIREFANVTLK